MYSVYSTTFFSRLDTALMMQEILKSTHPEWHAILNHALSAMDTEYLAALSENQFDYLPQKQQLFQAFTRPLSKAQYILFGESPYPRANSANGYAFWDANVGNLWSEKGLSKAVNRATSLRNIMKMLLHARGDLTADFSQPAIAALDKTQFHQSAEGFFTALLDKGFILLNASLVYESVRIPYHAKHWAPFMAALLDELVVHAPNIQLLLFGRIAEKIPGYDRFSTLITEHPYNLSFITNPDVINFFKPMDLLCN